jgi:hypothetical protein
MTEQQLKSLRVMADPCSYRGALCYADCAAIQAALDEIDRLTEQARRYYHADGSYEVLDAPEAVIARRIEAAGELARMRAEIDRLQGELNMAQNTLEIVRAMRAAQREFFDPKRRRPDTVGRAKILEKRVDAALGPDPAPEPTLF